MRKSGGSFGLLLLLIAMGIVLILVMKSFRSSIPTASEMRRAPEESPTDASQPPNNPSGISGMRNMKRQTDQHTTQVQDALDASR